MNPQRLEKHARCPRCGYDLRGVGAMVVLLALLVELGLGLLVFFIALA